MSTISKVGAERLPTIRNGNDVRAPAGGHANERLPDRDVVLDHQHLRRAIERRISRYRVFYRVGNRAESGFVLPIC
ncbi:MAG: hypothetical protein WBG86_17495 [Polyangiales bacterium]